MPTPINITMAPTPITITMAVMRNFTSCSSTQHTPPFFHPHAKEREKDSISETSKRKKA